MYKTNEDGAFELGLGLGFILGGCFAILISSFIFTIPYKELKIEAVKTGHAEYAVDEYGHTTFNFKDHTDKKEDLKHE